ncbi:cytochrome b5 domain-containing protein [Patescibacteria group bacterium]|nr:cytochrome b5 domain-containing protein [Patescibacteria group bacterium]
MSIYKYLIVIPLLLVLTGCGAQISKEVVSQDQASNPKEVIQTYTMNEVSLHNSKDSCWLLLNGKVYDVTPMIDGHGGGDAILEGCGTNATELYETRPMGSGTPHSKKAYTFLPNYYIGDLEQ